MFSERDLKSFLEEISAEAKFLKFHFVSTEKFLVELKCKVDKDETPEFYSQFSGEWIRKFSKFTATTWIVRHCFPKLKRLLYRKVYVCHRSAFNKKKKPDVVARNQDCKAKVEFKMKFINRNTIKNDRLLKDGLNLTISINFSHTHKVRTPEAFNLLKSTSETDSIFQEYFNTGCSRSAAKSYHELTLIDKYGENCMDILSNANINPSLRHVLYIYSKRKKDGIENHDFRSIIESKKQSLSLEGHAISFTEDPEIIVIITPTMKRTIGELSLDCVIIDSTPVPNGPVVTFYYVPSKIGALPIACVIHAKENKSNFFQAFSSVKLALEEHVNNCHPSFFMLSDLNEQRLITSLYPNSKSVSSKYALCIEFWKWINDDENKIERKRRHGIMLLIKTLLYADSAENAEKIYTEIKDDENVDSRKVRDYVEDLWERREEWLTSDDLSNNLVDASIRFTKEFITRKCKSFNNCLMLDVVARIMENHQRRILSSYVTDTKIISTYTKFLPKAKTLSSSGSSVKNRNEYRIEFQPRPKKYLYFRTDTMFCDCLYGKRGQLCEHLCTIINVVDTEIMKVPSLNEDEKEVFSRIAGGVMEDQESVKQEFSEEAKDDNHVDLEEATTDLQDLDDHESVASSPKSDVNNYFYVEVKTERCDPLEDECDQDIHEVESSMTENAVEMPTTSKTSNIDMKKNYEKALKAVNDEFRRLNRFFSENPNRSNLETMTRLARELAKIRPVERVNLSGLELTANRNKRKRNDGM